MKVCQISTVQTRHHIRIFYRMSRSLVRTGYEVVVICADDLPDEVSDGVTIKSIGPAPRNRIERMIHGNAVFSAALNEDADVYQVNAPENLPVALKLKRCGKRVIFDSHEDHPANIAGKSWIPFGFGKLIALLYGMYEKMVVSRLDATFAPAAYVVDRLRDINPNAYLVTNYPIIEDELSNCSADRAPVVCFVGNATRDDNHMAVIEALTKVKGLQYRMVVWEENSHTEELRYFSKRLAVDDRVEILPRMNQSQLREIQSAAIAGVITRRYLPNYGFRRGSEGIVKFYEYLASGLPVVCTDYEIWREIVAKYDCGICVNPDSVRDIVDALSYLVANPDRVQQMGVNARRAAVERYNWTTQEEVYLNAFSKLLYESGAKRS